LPDTFLFNQKILSIYHLKFNKEVLDLVIRKKSERVFMNPGYTGKMTTWKPDEKFENDFMVIFNKAGAGKTKKSYLQLTVGRKCEEKSTSLVRC